MSSEGTGAGAASRGPSRHSPRLKGTRDGLPCPCLLDSPGRWPGNGGLWAGKSGHTGEAGILRLLRSPQLCLEPLGLTTEGALAASASQGVGPAHQGSGAVLGPGAQWRLLPCVFLSLHPPLTSRHPQPDADSKGRRLLYSRGLLGPPAGDLRRHVVAGLRLCLHGLVPCHAVARTVVSTHASGWGPSGWPGALQGWWVRDQTGLQPFPDAGGVRPWWAGVGGLGWGSGLLCGRQMFPELRPGPLLGAGRPRGQCGLRPLEPAQLKEQRKQGVGGEPLVRLPFLLSLPWQQMAVWQQRGGGGLCTRLLRVWKPAGVLQGWGGSSGHHQAEQAPRPRPPGAKCKAIRGFPFPGAPASHLLTVAPSRPLPSLFPPLLGQSPHPDTPTSLGQRAASGALQLNSRHGPALPSDHRGACHPRMVVSQ